MILKKMQAKYLVRFPHLLISKIVIATIIRNCFLYFEFLNFYKFRSKNDLESIKETKNSEKDEILVNISNIDNVKNNSSFARTRVNSIDYSQKKPVSLKSAIFERIH
jgi:hypothetical protein